METAFDCRGEGSDVEGGKKGDCKDGAGNDDEC